MRRLKESIYKWIFMVLAFASLIFLLGIVIVLFQQSLPVFKETSFSGFLFGRYWYPTYAPHEFGILPLVLASAWVTFGALLVCVPLGVGSALYLHEIAGAKAKAVLKPLIEILAGIPSIVFGFYGMVVVAPFIQKLLGLDTGLTVFTASLVLGIMSVPTIASMAEDALNHVPVSFKEASYAVGANRWQTLTQVVIPAAGSGISTAVILGMSRAVGETMTVMMVAGGAAVIPHTFFEPVRPMTATIAAEMGEAVTGSAHYSALFAIGLLLFLFTLAFNIVAEIVSRRYRLKLGLSR